MRKILIILIIINLFFETFFSFSQDDRVRIPIPRVNIGIDEARSPQEVALSLQILFLLSILTLAPSMVILMTSFLRIAIVFDFMKRALSLQQMPPNQVIFGLSLFLTLFIMWPTFETINSDAIQPFFNQDEIPPDQRINIDQFFERGIIPIREFMFRQTAPKYIGFFMNMRNLDAPKTYDDVPTYVLIPAFVINEMTVGFQIGVMLFIPFIIIDMIVASTLMAMGMIMLPPVMISLPFKLIIFVLVDGWQLLVESLFRGFG